MSPRAHSNRACLRLSVVAVTVSTRFFSSSVSVDVRVPCFVVCRRRLLSKWQRDGSGASSLKELGSQNGADVK